MFRKEILDIDNSFEKLSQATIFEDYIKGRKAGIIIDSVNNTIPIVRTTTKYNNPVQRFQQCHYDLVRKIRETFKEDGLQFNNAMVELYDSNYRRMGFHTDQALDLEKDSYICLFSCYETTPTKPQDIRTLQVKNKLSEEEFTVSLDHNSAVLFSTQTNCKHLHKIILSSNCSNNKWIGITFRLSKTFVNFQNGIPFIEDKFLKLASEEEQKEFRTFKRSENTEIDYNYPEIDYTISASDLMELV